MNQTLKITNPQGELLDTLIEGNPKTPNLCLFVHGFGTDKHETQGLFDDISTALQGYFLVIRFDFSGYGLSEGRQLDVNYFKQTQDLQAIISWINSQFSDKIKHLIAMSMGCYVTALLKPQNLHKTILLSIPDQSTDTLKVRIKQRLLDRCGQFNEAGISTYPRSSGQVQNIGPSFWQVMDQLDPLKEITSLAQITQLHIIHPRSDEIVDTSNIQAYRLIHSINYYEIPGNHSFTNHTNRKQLIKKIQQIVKS